MATYAQNLVIYKIDLVLLLLLLIFYNILLSYSLVLIRTITATSIPVRRNNNWAKALKVLTGMRALLSQESQTLAKNI